MNILLENSLSITSNLEKLLSKLYEGEELTEKNVTTDLSPYKKLIADVINRHLDKVDFKDICSVINVNTPSGVIPVVGTRYVGKESANATVNTRILLVPNSASFTEGGFISTNGTGLGVGKVLHVEAGKILVEVTSGYFSKADNLDNVAVYASSKTTVTAVYSANTNYSSFLENYDGVDITADAEIEADLKEIVNIISNIEINCTTKSLSSGYTVETLSDAISVYGYQYKEKLIETIVNLLARIEKARIFKFMKDNAYVRPNLVLTNSYGVNGAILDVFGDLYVRLNQSAGAITQNTGISDDFVVVASTRIYRALISMAPLTEVEKKVTLPSDMILVEDPFSMADYLCVALKSKADNSAVIYTPFSVEVQSVTDPVDFQQKVKVFARSDIKNNPLATMINDQSKNEMMEITYVDGYSFLNNVF